MEGVLKILNDATHTFIIENDQSCDMDNSFEIIKWWRVSWEHIFVLAKAVNLEYTI